MPLKPKLRVFLDSNVILAALCSPGEPAGAILERFLSGELAVVISQQVLEEVVQTIKEKLSDALPVFKKFFVSLPPEIVKNPSPAEVVNWSQLIHLQHAAILAAAIAAQPDYLITIDQHFFENPEIVKKSGLRIVTPAQFLVLS
jgi:putative PIN family toxin of toxin-antitoxin system